MSNQSKDTADEAAVLAEYERLSAYLDGELSPEAAQALEREMAETPALRARFDALAGLNDDLSTIGAEMLAEAEPAAPQARPIAPPRASSRRRGPAGTGVRRAIRPALALAASVAAGVLVWTWTSGGPGGGAALHMATGPVPTEGPVFAALETAPTGVALEQDRVRVVPIGTFYDGSNRVCREVEILRDAGPSDLEIGVACRDGAQDWRMLFAAVSPAGDPVGDAFKPAAGPGLDALTGFLDSLGATPLLSPEEEQGLIDRGWAAP